MENDSKQKNDVEASPTSSRAPPIPSADMDVPPSKKAKQEVAFNGSSTPLSSTYPRSIGVSIEHTAPAQKPSQPTDAAAADTTPAAPAKRTHCQHDVSLPAAFEGDYDFNALSYPAKPAKQYDFPLDAFQRQSVMCIEKNESVLVAAHTSAGKTVVAEYAIALALSRNQRVIYTSPIKALSNQKYRELQAEFSDVGLMTGDTTIDKNASCLVMTTEILRSMLYRGSEVVREVSWVVFDEVHYMRDKERGVVWEEAIILVPQSVRFVFLSATIPNAREFSEWVAHLKQTPCHTIYTPTRPVPLMHYIYPVGADDGLHLVVDDQGTFIPKNFEKAMAQILASRANMGGSGGTLTQKKKRGSQGGNIGKADCYKVIDMIRSKGYHPVIVFAFSRRECEGFAMQLAKLDFNTDEEREFVQTIFENAVNSLNEEDRALPQITAILPLLMRGVGIHHSGLLPIIKEVVELMFHEGLIKCLFATETFAMGVNMPARTVLFAQLRKFDGETYRFLNGSEYVQMSGRAGRRGVDEQGISILMLDEQMDPTVAKNLTKGTSEPLTSTFRLGYNMVLNLLRAEEADPEYVIVRSFAQFQGERSIPQLQSSIRAAENKRDAICIGGPRFGVQEHEVRSYFKLREVAERLKQEVRDIVHAPGPVNAFLQGGRLCRVHVRRRDKVGVTNTRPIDYDYGWGIVVDFQKRGPAMHGPSQKRNITGSQRYVVQILLRCVSGSNRGGAQPVPFKPTQGTAATESKEGRSKQKMGIDREEWLVVECSLNDLQGLSAIRVNKPSDLRSNRDRSVVGRSVLEVMRRFPDGPPMLDPLTDMGIKDANLAVMLRKVEAIDEAMIASPVSKCDHVATLAKLWKERQEADESVKKIKKKLKEATGLILQEDLKKMKRVCKRLGFTNNDGIVEVKGRVACEVNTADELVITELLLGGNMNEMSAEVLVSLCSCFVMDEGRKDDDKGAKLEKELQVAFDKLAGAAKRVGMVKNEAGLEIDVEQYVESFRPQAMRVVYFWMHGKSFSEVCALTDLFEGSVIRCFRRLDELLHQLITAVRAIGNTELADKFEQGAQKLQRGIAFQSSLYV